MTPNRTKFPLFLGLTGRNATVCVCRWTMSGLWTRGSCLRRLRRICLSIRSDFMWLARSMCEFESNGCRSARNPARFMWNGGGKTSWRSRSFRRRRFTMRFITCSNTKSRFWPSESIVIYPIMCFWIPFSLTPSSIDSTPWLVMNLVMNLVMSLHRIPLNLVIIPLNLVIIPLNLVMILVMIHHLLPLLLPLPHLPHIIHPLSCTPPPIPFPRAFRWTPTRARCRATPLWSRARSPSASTSPSNTRIAARSFRPPSPSPSSGVSFEGSESRAVVPSPRVIQYYWNETLVQDLKLPVLEEVRLVPRTDADYHFFDITPVLPRFLTFDPETGKISGIPLFPLKNTSFTIQGHSTVSVVTCVITLEFTALSETPMTGGRFVSMNGELAIERANQTAVKKEVSGELIYGIAENGTYSVTLQNIE